MRGKGGRSSRSSNSMKKMTKISSETIVICVLLVILLILVIYYVKQNNEGFQNNKANNAEKCDVYVFVADWCPHCNNAKPAIAELKNNAPAHVNVNVVNEKDKNSRELMNKYKVRGFPTILLVKADGEVVEFVKSVSIDNLNSFVATNSN
jgi:thioredoxin 1